METADLLITPELNKVISPNLWCLFALIMVESRLIRYANELESEIDRKDIDVSSKN